MKFFFGCLHKNIHFFRRRKVVHIVLSWRLILSKEMCKYIGEFPDPVLTFTSLFDDQCRKPFSKVKLLLFIVLHCSFSLFWIIWFSFQNMGSSLTEVLYLTWQICYPICLGIINFFVVIGIWMWLSHPRYLFLILRRYVNSLYVMFQKFQECNFHVSWL